MKLIQLGLAGNFQEIDVSTGGSANFIEELKLIGAGDVAAGYIYTSQAALENSLKVSIEGAVLIEEIDYSVQYLTDRAKIIWINDYATGGDQEVIAGEKFQLQYATADSALDFIKDNVILDAQDVLNQYVDLSVLAKPNSLTVLYQNTQLAENLDYTTTDLSDRTRISFAGEFALGGLSAFEAGDRIDFQFCILPN